MTYPKLPFLFLPYVRLELPLWGKLVEKLHITYLYEELWRDAPTKTIRGKMHGYVMNLDLSNWSERLTYFIGRFYDLPLQLIIKNYLKPGDIFVDIGANIGMITILAAKYVGENGFVHSFEPNPEAYEKLNEVVTVNQLKQVKLYQFGLSNENTELTLSMVTEHTGMGTFASLSEKDEQMVTKQYKLPVYIGDEVLIDKLSENCLIKIDVEGFEPYVIEGLSGTIERYRPAIVTEAIKSHLQRAGYTLDDFYSKLKAYGYRAFKIGAKRNQFLVDTLRLKEITIDYPETADIIWLHPDNKMSSRFKDLF